MRIIKRYKNRRLYDTETKKMVTIDDLSVMVKEDTDFKVVDNVNKKDITGEILTTILKSEVKSWKDVKESRKLIRELITQKGAGAANFLKKTAMASIGAISIDRKRAEEIIDELIKKGEIASSRRGEEVKKLIGKADGHSKKLVDQSKKVIEKAGDESKRIYSKVQDQITISIEKFGKENRNEIAKINEKISSLEETLKRIDEKLG
ncbi:MAG: hypothetical protein GY855_03390 [candidate division Zixibacteria bacterium]|nr:hypothetical protein [candidate division Zixibacteria bacterium]